MRLALTLVLLVAGSAVPQELSPAAAKAYEEARSLWKLRTENGLREALSLFEEAATLAPGFGDAHAGIADAACLLALYGYAPPEEVLPRAREAAARALELEPELATAHASLGLVRYLYEWSFDEAEESFRRAIALEPDYAAVHHWYGMMLLATGRHDEALAQVEAASALEPGSALYATKRGTVLLASGRLDEAERQLRLVVERFPELTMAYRELGELELERGRPLRALEPLERGARDDATYGYVLARVGREAEARRMLDALRSEAYASPIDIALLHAGLGERDRALSELERALELKDPALVYIGLQPGFASLRAEPRFQEILTRMGLKGRP